MPYWSRFLDYRKGGREGILLNRMSVSSFQLVYVNGTEIEMIIISGKSVYYVVFPEAILWSNNRVFLVGLVEMDNLFGVYGEEFVDKLATLSHDQELGTP